MNSISIKSGKSYWFTQRTRQGERRFEVRVTSVEKSPRFPDAVYVSWYAADCARDACGSFGASNVFETARPFGIVAVEPGTTPQSQFRLESPRPGDRAYDLMC